MTKRERLSDGELLAAISSAEDSALGSFSSVISADRADAQDRYYGKPYGDELPGRSQVVSRDVADVVEGVVANVVKPFVGGDHVVVFNPVGPEDEQAAEQETDYVNFIALERNEGFVWLTSAIKDALLKRAGYVKCSWEVRSDILTETYAGQNDEELAALMQDADVEVIEHTEYPDPYEQAAQQMAQPQQPAMAMMQGQQPGAQPMPPVAMLHDVKVRRVKPTEYVLVEPVPGDEVIVSERARTPSLQNVDFVQHRTHKPLSELRQAGYDVPDDITDDDQGDTLEEISRQRFMQTNVFEDVTNDPSRRIVLFKESYIRIDRDGDGIAELRRVCQVGNTLLADEECDIVPLASFSGVLVPHQHLGLSVYDLVEDLAKIKTALMRSYLDNRYLQNNGRYAVNATNVNLDDFLVSRPGGVVRVDGDPSANIFPLVAPDTSAGALQGLEYLDSVREQRTGYTRNSAGIANDALTNRTATGMTMQLSQSQLRLEMIARTIAETGAKDVFRIIHALTLKHSSCEEKVRLKGKWVMVNPREWARRNDLSIAIGLGTGTPEQQLAKLMQLAPMLQTLQPMGLVGTQQAYNFATEMFKLTGYKDADRFVKPPQIDPQTGEAQEPPPSPPPEVQVAQMKAQADSQLADKQLQADAQKFQAEQAGKQQELQQHAQLEMQKLSIQSQAKDKEQQNALIVQQQNDQRDAQRSQMEHEFKVQQMALDNAFKEKELAYKMELEKYKADLKAQTDVHMANQQAQTQVGLAQHATQAQEKPKSKGYNVIRGADGKTSRLEAIH